MRSFHVTLLGALSLTFVATNAFALECTVADPSGTPMNVRARPNGAILGALHNDETVFVSGVTSDGRGRKWAKIAPLNSGKSGWVARDLLSCP